MIEGRSFSRAFSIDTSAFILNEKAVEIMGIRNPVGKMFSVSEYTGSIIGVVKNFHFKSLKNKIEPLFFGLGLERVRRVFIKISSSDIQATMNHINRTWKRFVPDYETEFTFLDSAYDRLYRSEMRTGIIIDCFTFLAILITALGLFGLASFSAEKRKKEIGIRKVVGATVPQITKLFLKEFMVLVVLANIISWPASYFAMKQWLHNYAYHTDLSLQVFILAFAIALLIAVVSVSYHSIKAATANPIKSLRYE
jgi:putative ABC transport system permease protein